MNETVGLRLVRGTDLDALASGLIASLGGPGADPFLRPLVFTPSAGVARWLSQRIARSGDPGGEGGVRRGGVGAPAAAGGAGLRRLRPRVRA